MIRFKNFILLLLFIIFFTNTVLAQQKIWITTTFDMSLNQNGLSQWRLDQSFTFPLARFFSLSALFGYSYYYEDDSGYKIMLGGTFIFPKNWYIDLMYGFYFTDSINRHEVLITVNFEKNQWYLAFKQIIKFGPDLFTTISYIYSIYNFPNGYSFSVDSAIGYEKENGISYALWMKSYLAFFPILGFELGTSFGIERSLFNLSIILGIKFNFPIFSIAAYWQPYFFARKGISDVGFSLILKL